MKKKKKWIGIIALAMCFLIAFGAVWFGVQQGQEPPVTIIPDEDVPLGGSQGTLIKENDYDKNIIPDKYNCGATGKLKKVKLGATVGKVKLKSSDDKNVMEFAYSNKGVSGTVTIKNMDFSENQLSFSNEDKVDRNIKVKFVNCKFGKVLGGMKKTKVTYSFTNCTFTNFSGSSASFDRCLFGQYFTDGLVPFQSITVKNSYFKDMAVENSKGKGLHTDGTQIYGNAKAIVKDVWFDNCRFEIPAIETSSASAKVNACLMVQLEFNDANGIKFTNCNLNGGGYSIYAWDKEKGYKLNNVVFKNINIGCAHTFGNIYPKISSEVVFDNVKDAASLYVTSVWQDKKKTHLLVTNDTSKDRTLIVYTDQGVYTKKIKACPSGYKNQSGLYKNFDEFPFDVEVTVPVVAKYVVCYEIIDEQLKQLRFENWTKKKVYVDETKLLKKYKSKGTTSQIETQNVPTNPTDTRPNSEEQVSPSVSVEHMEGQCGNDVTFELDGNILHIKGTGATWDFSSDKNAPWFEVKDQITVIEIDEGVSVLGNQMFRQCTNVSSVSLPDSLTEIKNNVFITCKMLTEITLPSELRVIGKYAFEGTNLNKCHVAGGQSQWNEMSIGANNDKLISAISFE